MVTGRTDKTQCPGVLTVNHAFDRIANRAGRQQSDFVRTRTDESVMFDPSAPVLDEVFYSLCVIQRMHK